MDNDNKINEENLVLEEKNEIHQKVMLFLGEELENIHKSSQKQIYDIEKEYDKTKKLMELIKENDVLGRKIKQAENLLNECEKKGLKEMKKDLIEFKNFVGDNAECAGLQNILDDYMQNINKWNYLRTFV